MTFSPLSGGLCTSCQAFVPAPAFLRLFRPRSRFVDEISALLRAPSLQPSRRRNPQVPLGQSCLRPGPLTRLPLLPLPVASPAEPRLVSRFLRISHFGLADVRYPLSTGCCRTCSAGDETPPATELCIACRTGDESSGFPRILHPAARAAKRNLRLPPNLHLPMSKIRYFSIQRNLIEKNPFFRWEATNGWTFSIIIFVFILSTIKERLLSSSSVNRTVGFVSPVPWQTGHFSLVTICISGLTLCLVTECCHPEGPHDPQASLPTLVYRPRGRLGDPGACHAC